MVSHLLEFLVLPPGLLGVGLGICALLVLLRPKGKIARFAIVTLMGFYYLLGTFPVSNLLIGSLERRVPATVGSIDPNGVAAIVILAGAASFGGERSPGELNAASWRRLWRGIEVYRELDGAVPILFSGGGRPGDPTARLAMAAAVRWGVPAERFWVEDVSRNTQASA